MGKLNVTRFRFKMRFWWISYVAQHPWVSIHQMDGRPQDLVKSWNREIWVYIFPIALKFDRHQQRRRDVCQISKQYDINNI